MALACTLCGEPLTGRERRCSCGWRLDSNCQESHDQWCPAEGEDRWLGAHER